ncbi:MULTISPECIES: YolD-like family protein [unclassified Adlercreutzia]|uniref:YolD-like family protein n=1 Tax=unclassified Adlercreutzia TaxID=2636013 RepID=UPI001F149E6F|nr:MULTISPECIES: YolD-like family protein [unclassified Adlercreutzia]
MADRREGAAAGYEGAAASCEADEPASCGARVPAGRGARTSAGRGSAAREADMRPVLAEDVAWASLDERAARRVIGKPHPDRARQFKPFAALKGYYDLLAACERVPEPRRELTEEEQRELGEQLSRLVRGQVVTVTYYEGDASVTLTGAVAQVDTILRTLQIIQMRIPFDAIARIAEEPLESPAQGNSPY